MLTYYSRLLDGVEKVIKILEILLLAAITLIMIYQCIMRYGFHSAQPAAADGAGAGLGQLLRQRQSPRRERNVRAGHRFVPRRNSVVNAGSYSLLRSYCAAKKSPTTMSAVLVMPAARVHSASVPTVQCTIFCSGHVAL